MKQEWILFLVLFDYAVCWLRQPTTADHLGTVISAQDNITAFTSANENKCDTDECLSGREQHTPKSASAEFCAGIKVVCESRREAGHFATHCRVGFGKRHAQENLEA